MIYLDTVKLVYRHTLPWTVNHMLVHLLCLMEGGNILTNLGFVIGLLLNLYLLSIHMQ